MNNQETQESETLSPRMLSVLSHTLDAKWGISTELVSPVAL